jgi:hypothetical protein
LDYAHVATALFSTTDKTVRRCRIGSNWVKKCQAGFPGGARKIVIGKAVRRERRAGFGGPKNRWDHGNKSLKNLYLNGNFRNSKGPAPWWILETGRLSLPGKTAIADPVEGVPGFKKNFPGGPGQSPPASGSDLGDSKFFAKGGRRASEISAPEAKSRSANLKFHRRSTRRFYRQ